MWFNGSIHKIWMWEFYDGNDPFSLSKVFQKSKIFYSWYAHEYVRISGWEIFVFIEAVVQRCSVIKVLFTSTRVSFLIKLQPATLLKKRLWHRCFSVTFAKFLRTFFLENTFGRLLLELAPHLGYLWKSVATH